MNKLPASYMEAQIGDMHVGDFGWTVPWAMEVDHEGTGRLNASYTISPTPGGTVEMALRRLPTGFCVWLPPTYRWTPAAHHGWATLPVVEMRTDAPPPLPPEGSRNGPAE